MAALKEMQNHQNIFLLHSLSDSMPSGHLAFTFIHSLQLSSCSSTPHKSLFTPLPVCCRSLKSLPILLFFLFMTLFMPVTTSKPSFRFSTLLLPLNLPLSVLNCLSDFCHNASVILKTYFSH